MVGAVAAGVDAAVGIIVITTTITDTTIITVTIMDITEITITVVIMGMGDIITIATTIITTGIMDIMGTAGIMVDIIGKERKN